MTTEEELKITENVRSVKARYFRFTDSKSWSELATIFCKEASLGGVEGPSFTGVDNIVELIRRGTDRVTTVHHGHCHEVWVDSPTQARGVIAFEDLGFSKKTDELVMHGYGHYHETYRKLDGEWLFATIHLRRLRLVTTVR